MPFLIISKGRKSPQNKRRKRRKKTIRSISGFIPVRFSRRKPRDRETRQPFNGRIGRSASKENAKGAALSPAPPFLFADELAQFSAGFPLGDDLEPAFRGGRSDFGGPQQNGGDAHSLRLRPHAFASFLCVQKEGAFPQNRGQPCFRLSRRFPFPRARPQWLHPIGQS